MYPSGLTINSATLQSRLHPFCKFGGDETDFIDEALSYSGVIDAYSRYSIVWERELQHLYRVYHGVGASGIILVPSDVALFCNSTTVYCNSTAIYSNDT